MSHKVIEIRNLSPSAYVLRLERKGFVFKPGQCVNLGLKGSGVNREYSTYSGADAPWLEFLIKEVKGGTVSSKLRHVAVGDEIDLHGPYGSFVVDPAKLEKSHFVFIGTGTGVAPFHSFVCSYPSMNYEVIVGIKSASERYDERDYDRSKLTYCVSRESWEGFNGRVTDYLRGGNIDPSHIYYLCGNQGMIHNVYDLLRQKGVSGDRIYTEAFF